MLKKILFFALIATLLASYSYQQTGTVIIHVNGVKQTQINLSEYFASLEYVPLETNSACLIDRNPIFYVLDEYIVAFTHRQCFLFDRKGKFIREIGRYGQGPDEYLYTLKCVDELNKTVVARGSDNLLEYSFSGKVSRRFPSVLASNPTYLSDSILVLGVSNPKGDAINQLVFINTEKVVDSIPNHQFFNLHDPSVYGGIGSDSYFYRYSNDLYYKNLYNDTIFRIIDRQLHPAWKFDMGRYSLPISIRANIESLRKDARKYNQVHTILETDPFMLFSIFSERGDSAYIFDKRKNQTFILQKEQRLKGFYNDIDGGLPFWPIHINLKQEMVAFLYPFTMKEMLTDDYFGRKTIRDKAANLRLRELIKRLDDEDNPILVIATLKP